MAFSYDSSNLDDSTASGRRYLVRLLIGDTADTDAHPAIFEDSELDAFLSLNADAIYYAAAQACEVWAATQSRLAKRLERDGSIHERFTPAELLKVAAQFREAAVAGSASGTVQTGRITSSRREYLGDYRPTWWNLNGTWPE
jgi:hypothetical protein